MFIVCYWVIVLFEEFGVLIILVFIVCFWDVGVGIGVWWCLVS